MKQFNLFCRLMLMFAICSISFPVFSQGVAIYKKDGTMVKYSYAEVDSIVTFNYGEEPEVTPDVPQYQAIDLGLPSGIKWASFNVGATKPEEYGGYYAWGETEEKENYSWATYKWCNGDEHSMTKYCTNSSYGVVDNKEILEPEDDVAHVKWGGDWRMPTRAEQDELRNNCTWEWTALNGVNGYRVTGPNGNSIFLPAVGYRDGTNIDYTGSIAYYWSSSLNSDRDFSACNLYFKEGYFDWYYYSRYYGRSVRPVTE